MSYSRSCFRLYLAENADLPRRLFTLREAVEMILESDNSDNEADVCILPPLDGARSDCEHIDEDDLAPVEPADVCDEVEVFNSTNSGGPDSEDDRAEQAGHHVIQQKVMNKIFRAKQPKASTKPAVEARAYVKRQRQSGN